MNAAVFYQAHRLLVENLPMPEPEDDQVVLRVMACGVCGTDVHIYEGDEGAAQTPAGTTLGHEFAGVVTAVGRSVSGFRPGDRVCVDPNKLCGSCDYCRSGMGHFCEHMTGIGTTVHGGFAEYCAVPQSQAYHIPDWVTFQQAAMTEPVACCLHGVDLCEISCGDTVMVLGGGMIGLIMVQLARLSGAGRVILSEPVESKRALGKQLGADLCLDPSAGDLPAQLQREGVGRVGVVIECAGRTETVTQALDCAGNKATVMLFGLTKPSDQVAVQPFQLFKKELTLKTSYINPYTQKRALDLIGSGRLDVSSMVCQTAPLDQLAAILADPALRSKGKWIILPNG